MSMLADLYPFVRPLLFSLDAERAHHLTLSGLAHLGANARILVAQSRPSIPRQVMGLTFPNPVGLAAGLDKNGAALKGLAALGFGFIELGTVTPKPQPGNPKPRMFRIQKAHALINRMGFNNAGLEQFLLNVREAHVSAVLGLNIGKNASTPTEDALSDYLLGLRGVYSTASYVTVNISSPNTQGLRSLQQDKTLSELLAALKEEQRKLQAEHGRYVPIAVKIAPDLNDEELSSIARNLLSNEIDGVIATNTTIARDAVELLPHGTEKGGLSGTPVRDASTRVIAKLKTELGDKIPIIGVGGILTGADAVDKIKAGAALVQIYTGLIYRGPKLIAECVKAIDEVKL